VSSKILVVDDEAKIVRLVRSYLEQSGFVVVEANDGQMALIQARREKPDLVVLDLGLPGIDGLEVARTLRRERDTPIIMLTARIEDTDKIVGLELGADDYMTKPFSPRELLARVRAVLRRAKPARPGPDVCRFGDVEIDFEKYEAKKGGKPFDLSALEFSLLRSLVRHGDRVVPRDTLLDEVWGKEVYVAPRTVDKHVSQLRKKIGDDPKAPRHILGVRGVGYRFKG